MSIVDWLGRYEPLLWWLGIGSAVMFVGTLALVPILIARLPADYFTKARRRRPVWAHRHPALWSAAVILRNVAGMLVVLAGIAMLLLPGQGLLAILVGLTLTNFPGKTEFLRWLVRRPAVARALNWIRARAGRSPLEIPADPS